MRQHPLHGLDHRNRNHGQEEDQRGGRHILPAIEKLAEGAIIGIVLGRRAALFGVMRHQLELGQSEAIGFDMDMGLGGVGLEEEGQQQEGGEDQPRRRGPACQTLRGSSPSHFFITRKDRRMFIA